MPVDPCTSDGATTASMSSELTGAPDSLANRTLDGQIDLGSIVLAANGSWERLRALVMEMNDDRKSQYLSFHFKPATSELYTHTR